MCQPCELFQGAQCQLGSAPAPTTLIKVKWLWKMDEDDRLTMLLCN